jgi:hypothetical protein
MQFSCQIFRDNEIKVLAPGPAELAWQGVKNSDSSSGFAPAVF